MLLAFQLDKLSIIAQLENNQIAVDHTFNDYNTYEASTSRLLPIQFKECRRFPIFVGVIEASML